MWKVFFGIGALIYFAGCYVTNDLVREACTHGNCIHGWYSKYNDGEKAVAIAWMIGFPITLLLLREGIRHLNGEAAQEAEMHRRAAETRATAAKQQHAQRLKATFPAKSRKAWTCNECHAEFAAGTKYCYYLSGRGRYASREKYCAVCRDKALRHLDSTES